MGRYPIRPQDWRTTPLEPTLPDDDEGYRNVRLHQSDVSVAEVTECLVRPVYEGLVDIHGNPDDSLKLEGGLKDGRVFGVETVVRGIEACNKMLKKVSGGEFQLVTVEVIRTRARQRAGHRKTFWQMLEADGISDPSAGQVWEYGRKADQIFSYVPPDKTTDAYAKLMAQLAGNDLLIRGLRDAAKLTDSDNVSDVLAEYVTIMASLDLGPVADAKLEMPASHMVHGGGAFDVFIANAMGKIISVAPFDYLGAEGFIAYRFTEDDSNYDRLMAQAKVDPILRAHFTKMGYAELATFTRSSWDYFKQANRMQVRAIIAMGGTTYSHERWHFEFGTQVTDFEGNSLIQDALYSEFPKSGGTGYTVIRQGQTGTAVWHTAVTEAALRKRGLLEE